MIGENIINKGVFNSINLCWQSDNWEKKIRHRYIKELKRFMGYCFIFIKKCLIITIDKL